MSEIQFDQAARLGVMARQIADFFRPYPQEQAAASVADHINRFWTPRMRDEFLSHAREASSDLDPLIVAALVHIKPGRGKAG